MIAAKGVMSYELRIQLACGAVYARDVREAVHSPGARPLGRRRVQATIRRTPALVHRIAYPVRLRWLPASAATDS